MNKTKGLLVYLGYANQEALCSQEINFEPQLLNLFVVFEHSHKKNIVRFYNVFLPFLNFFVHPVLVPATS